MVRRSRSDCRLLAFALAFIPAASGAAWAQGTPTKAASGASPALPDAVTTPPSWLPPGAPFDVAKFLAAPPDARNAAPLYYEAMFELCGEPAACFAADEPRLRKRKDGVERAKRIGSLYEAQAQGRAPGPEVDALLADCGPGLKKLAEAQKRDRCAFATGLGIVSSQDHVAAARHLARILMLKSSRDLASGKTNDAIDDLAAELRLSRDLRPRGGLLAQLVAGSIESIAAREIAIPILAARGLKADAIDKVLKVLAEHEAAVMDAWAQAAQFETLSVLTTVRSLTADYEAFKSEVGVAPGTEPGKLLTDLSAGTSDPAADAAMNARLKGWKPADDAALAAILYARCKAMLDPGARTYSARLRLAKAPIGIGGADDPGLRRILDLQRPPMDNFLAADARSAAEIRAVRCLAALRRWKATKNVAPKDLESVVKAAGMSAVPTDPFDGRPFRMATIGGGVVVYSIGKDLKDDGGKIDSARDSKPGDLVFALDQPARR